MSNIPDLNEICKDIKFDLGLLKQTNLEMIEHYKNIDIKGEFESIWNKLVKGKKKPWKIFNSKKPTINFVIGAAGAGKTTVINKIIEYDYINVDPDDLRGEMSFWNVIMGKEDNIKCNGAAYGSGEWFRTLWDYILIKSMTEGYNIVNSGGNIEFVKKWSTIAKLLGYDVEYIFIITDPGFIKNNIVNRNKTGDRYTSIDYAKTIYKSADGVEYPAIKITGKIQFSSFFF